MLKVDQWLPYSQDKVFQFFSNAYNLEKITPLWLKFKVVGLSTDSIQDGTLINYKLKVHGIPIRWQSRIEEWQPQDKFVDTQIKGPYALWHHTHLFQKMQNGTLISDIVRYKVPFGILGRIFAGYFVKKDVEKIFAHRKETIEQIFRE